MKGLLTKDVALMLQRKKSFIILAIWAVVMCVAIDDGSFMMGWLTIISSFFAVSSLAYDEYDNCLPALMCLPVTEKIYALEKYLFAFICGITAWLYSAAVYYAVFRVMSREPGSELIQNIIFIPIFMLFIDVCLPLNLKFGSERGRMIALILGGVTFVVIIGAYKLMGDSFVYETPSLSDSAWVAIAFGSIAVLTAVSMLISVNIVNKKEY